MSMVRTGRRARALESLLLAAGFRAESARVSPPRIDELAPEARQYVLDVYLALGGIPHPPALRPGSWDLVFEGGLVVELDEELHFNRYRHLTLEPEWTAALPWRHDYLVHSVDHEAACLAAARWGARWTNQSCERLFGAADPPGTFGPVGAPRWKQRALYDAMKDASAVGRSDRILVRLATVDVIDDVRLGAVLDGDRSLDLEVLRSFVARRATREI
jgi:hypothetical protein